MAKRAKGLKLLRVIRKWICISPMKEIINMQFQQSIKKFIYEDNEIAARKVVARIINQIETILPQMPSAGRAGRVLRTRELVISKYPYVVPYQVKGNDIFILRVF